MADKLRSLLRVILLIAVVMLADAPTVRPQGDGPDGATTTPAVTVTGHVPMAQLLRGSQSARSSAEDPGISQAMTSGQVPASHDALREVFENERIEAAPFPHLQGTGPLTLPDQFPPDWSCPKCLPEVDHRPIAAWQYWQAEHYYLGQIAKSPAERERVWRDVDYSSPPAYQASVARHREHLVKMLGVTDLHPTEYDRVPLERDSVQVEDVTVWLQPDFSARALVFAPSGGALRGAVIAIPDANQTAQEFARTIEGETPEPWMQNLLQHNIAVAVPFLVERTDDCPLCKQLGLFGGPKDERHILEELGFIVGRSMTGLDVQQVLAVRDFLTSQMTIDRRRVELLGTGQGGMTAFYAAAADPDFSGVSVVNYFETRENSWSEPVDRMLYGQMNEFGDAEVAALVAPRPLDIAYTPAGQLASADVEAEAARAKKYYDGLKQQNNLTIMPEPDGRELEDLAKRIVARLGGAGESRAVAITAQFARKDAGEMSNDRFLQLHSYLQRLDEESDQVRDKRWQLLSTPPAQRAERAEDLRKDLARLMGVIPDDGTPLNPRTKLIRVTDRYMAYDVLLGVVNGVEAYGQLLVPRNAQARMPAVVCQHGYGGSPINITGVNLFPWETAQVYWEFGRALADRGYVVFAPYITTPLAVAEVSAPNLIRLAAALGMMRTSLEEKKLHKIVDFLQSLPVVDASRIGYYGLSYGGYASIWMPPLEPRLRFTAISGHFNDWRAKITNEELPTSYLRHPDLDFYNWDVLDRFTHVELIAAMYPRPVCVEFAERDSTTTPEWHRKAWDQVVAYAKAWDISDQIARIHFDGIHEIHGDATLDFIRRWLRPEEASGQEYAYDDFPRRTCKDCRASLAAEVERLEDQDNIPHMYRPDTVELPYLAHELDASKESLVRGRFRVGTASPVFAGMAIKASRAGYPGDLIMRFGSQEGGADIGEARVPANTIDPSFDLWWEGHVKPIRLEAGKEYYFELSAAAGSIPEGNYYVIYGPKPLGGLNYPPYLPVAYRVLTETQPHVPAGYQRFGFAKEYMSPYQAATNFPRAEAKAQEGDVVITRQWSVLPESADLVVTTAADDLREFFQSASGMQLSAGPTSQTVRLQVIPAGVEGVSTPEGFRVEASGKGIRIAALTPRGAMRGAYWLEDEFRLRHAPSIKAGPVVLNCRLQRRITTAVVPGGSKYTEVSHPLVYTDGLLQRISHSGFNGIWVWASTEELTLDSKVFPEFNDPFARERLARLDDVSKRAQKYGIDVYVYFTTGYNHHISESFFQSHPELRGYGWGPPLCTSNEIVRRYYAEVVQTLFRHAPDIKGLMVIYDSEGFYYCGHSERDLKLCPRCSRFTQQEVAAQLLTTLDSAMHQQGGSEKELIAWNYNVHSQWVLKLFPLLPKDIIIQGDFDKGMDVVRDGITNHTEDYNISNLGPPDLFVSEYQAARAAGLTVIAKTEHAVSQEFILTPYIPCMEQWYQRAARIRQYELGGFMANWDHYGYMPSRPALLINRMAFDPMPSQDQLLRELAERDFNNGAADHVLRAWHDYSEGIRAYPYSDPVARYPGPIQKGPSNPLFLDATIADFGRSRAWQNDLKWTAPWGPEITAKYLGQVEDWFAKGNSELEDAGRMVDADERAAVQAELGIGRTIASSVRSTLNLIDWLNARNDLRAARSGEERRQAVARLQRIALAERSNAEKIMPTLESDSRLGYASEGGGVGRGGLFSPELVRWKIGELEDVLILGIPALTEPDPHRKPAR